MYRSFTIILLGLICTIAFSPGATAQDAEPVEYVFKGTRIVNDQSVNLADKGELLLLVQHRFGDVSGGYYELFGLDQATMRLGFEYGFGSFFNAGIGRSTWLKTYDAFAKLRLVRQTSGFPFTAVISAGGSVPTIRNFFPEPMNSFSDKVSGNVQLLLAKETGNFGFQVSPGFIKTGTIAGLNKDLSFFITGITGSVKIVRKVSLNLEYLHAFNKQVPGDNTLSLGIDITTGGHLFQLIFSNNQTMLNQGFYSSKTGSWTSGNIYFGFNLIREFTLKYY
ncbi:DUF5777 family beta-barrel protein [Saccharicrinis sp. FJH62]|uniref:DUF5777 family beta-barrel protein n=1 Tax=Saccharicrinis sp. FJH62 TaxID=3344657 RepID=UPI0035D46C26